MASAAGVRSLIDRCQSGVAMAGRTGDTRRQARSLAGPANEADDGEAESIGELTGAAAINRMFAVGPIGARY